MTLMKQQSLGSGFEKYARTTKRARFLEQMDSVMPWSSLCEVIEPYYFKDTGSGGRPPIALERMLRIYFLQQWFDLSDPAAEEALYDSASMRRFAGIDLGLEAPPDETTICKFRHLLERNTLGKPLFDQVQRYLQEQGFKISKGTIVDATIIGAPSSTKNQQQQRDPEMHQTKKGNQWYFGMKAHIGVDADSGLVHTVRGTAGNVNDVVEAASLLHGQEIDAFGDAGYQGAAKRPDAKADVRWHIAMRPGKRAALKEDEPLDVLIDELERVKASIRAKVEHPFRVIKRQFGYTKVRYRGLKKNTLQLKTLFALSNLWMVRHQLLAAQG